MQHVVLDDEMAPSSRSFIGQFACLVPPWSRMTPINGDEQLR